MGFWLSINFFICFLWLFRLVISLVFNGESIIGLNRVLFEMMTLLSSYCCSYRRHLVKSLSAAFNMFSIVLIVVEFFVSLKSRTV